MADLSVIDRFTETFSRYIDSGFGLLGGDVAFLSSTLVAIDVTLAGLAWALRADDAILVTLAKKVLYVGAFAFIIGNFRSLADIVFRSFSAIGLKASGGSLSAADLMRPGFVASAGFTASHPLLEETGQFSGFDVLTNLPTILILLLVLDPDCTRLLYPLDPAVRHPDRVQADDACGLHPGSVRAVGKDRVPRREDARQCGRLRRQGDGARDHHRHRLDHFRRACDHADPPDRHRLRHEPAAGGALAARTRACSVPALPPASSPARRNSAPALRPGPSPAPRP